MTVKKSYTIYSGIMHCHTYEVGADVFIKHVNQLEYIIIKALKIFS